MQTTWGRWGRALGRSARQTRSQQILTEKIWWWRTVREVSFKNQEESGCPASLATTLWSRQALKSQSRRGWCEIWRSRRLKSPSEDEGSLLRTHMKKSMATSTNLLLLLERRRQIGLNQLPEDWTTPSMQTQSESQNPSQSRIQIRTSWSLALKTSGIK